MAEQYRDEFDIDPERLKAVIADALSKIAQVSPPRVHGEVTVGNILTERKRMWGIEEKILKGVILGEHETPFEVEYDFSSSSKEKMMRDLIQRLIFKELQFMRVGRGGRVNPGAERVSFLREYLVEGKPIPNPRIQKIYDEMGDYLVKVGLFGQEGVDPILETQGKYLVNLFKALAVDWEAHHPGEKYFPEVE